MGARDGLAGCLAGHHPIRKEEVMNKRRTAQHVSWSLLLVAVLLAALLGACGTDSPTGDTTTTVDGVISGSTATVGMKLCSSCHTTQTGEWMLTKHANVDPLGNLYSAGVPTLGLLTAYAIDCVRCHDPQGDSGQLVAGYTGNTVRPVVGCESCHGGGSLHVDGGGSGYIGFATLSAAVTGSTSTIYASAQFRTCTRCHQLLSATDPANPTTPALGIHDPASTAYPLGATESITDTHFATAGDWSGGGGANIKDITGYAMDFSSEKVCSDCHNPHRAPDQNREWAQSAHGDRNALATDYWSGAWAHYNWSCDGVPASACGSSRTACQRCHTTSGFSAYADALGKEDRSTAKAINDGLVALVTATSAWKPEMLQCRGCHTDNKGTLRNPGPITADYSYTTTTNNIMYTVSEASFAYPDVNASNVCLACHTGRENGETLKNMVLTSAPTMTSFAYLSFINSHYLTGGGTVFAATGFEYPGRNYGNLSSYRHDQIGTSSLPFSGSGGPCVGCHMSRPGGSGDHLFLPVTRSSTSIGHVEGISSEVCIYCHTVSGAGGLEELINERKEEYHESLLATMYVLDKRGYYFRGAHPYFYLKRNTTGLVTSIVGTLVSASSVTFSAVGVAAGDYFKMFDDGEYYAVVSVGTTTIEISPAYTGTVTSGDYAIIRSGSSGGVKNWLTRAGTGITPAVSTDTDASGYTTGRYNMGAAFNLNLVEHDPGAYVHNRIYTKRLLYDAIDWADDNLMNYSTGTTLSNLSATAKYKTGAMKYLLPYGVLGIAAERP